uniref:Putative secreted peptide n=1 Tax=Anopheles braziliensis TaxID=58242 RepID=A0A2M3ZPB8_9DIPT
MMGTRGSLLFALRTILILILRFLATVKRADRVADRFRVGIDTGKVLQYAHQIGRRYANDFDHIIHVHGRVFLLLSFGRLRNRFLSVLHGHLHGERNLLLLGHVGKVRHRIVGHDFRGQCKCSLQHRFLRVWLRGRPSSTGTATCDSRRSCSCCR